MISGTHELANEVRAVLRTRNLGRVLEPHDEIDSTNRRALAWAESGAPHGAVVVAEHQTAGQGRHGRVWTSSRGENLLFSVVLRLDVPVPMLGRVPLIAAVAVSDAVEAAVDGLEARLKWPNDVLLGGRKCAGLLASSQLGGGRAPVMVLGIGVNVNQASFPETLLDGATSLRRETGRTIPRGALLADLLGRLEAVLDRDLRPGAAWIDPYRRRLLGVGQSVRLRRIDSETPIDGILRGVDEAGALEIEVDGRIHTFTAGDTTLHSE